MDNKNEVMMFEKSVLFDFRCQSIL